MTAPGSLDNPLLNSNSRGRAWWQRAAVKVTVTFIAAFATTSVIVTSSPATLFLAGPFQNYLFPFNHIPDVVVTAFNDSGTRGVQALLKQLGISFCSWDLLNTGDNVPTATFTHPWEIPILKRLIQGSHGLVSNPEGYSSQPLPMSFEVQQERAGAEVTYECAKTDSFTGKWGYKNNMQLFKLPIMDVAFHGRTKYLTVARDPRDLCTGTDQVQFKFLANLTTFPSSVNTSTLETGECPKCIVEWAQSWASVLQSYEQNKNFRTFRIEDLVLPDPVTSDESKQIVNRITDFLKISPKLEAIQKELVEMHKHAGSYSGGHTSEDIKEEIVHEVANCPDTVHHVMLALGYRIGNYGLVKPASPAVISL